MGNHNTVLPQRKGNKMRKGCRSSKFEKKCPNYSYSLYRCTLGLVPYTCPNIEQPRPGTKKAKEANSIRTFYGKLPVENPDGIVTIDELYGTTYD
jgi:hypothetical protein